MKRVLDGLTCLLLGLWSASVFAQQGCQKPPQEVLEVLNASLPPTPFLSPDLKEVVFAQRVRYPAIADLAQAMLGVRLPPLEREATSGRTCLTYTKVMASG